ncbi:MAG: HD domain-containing protein [Terriglobia bacterium]
MNHLDNLSLENGSLLQHCQRGYRLEMRKLRSRHLNGEGGFSIATSRSILLDQLVQSIQPAFQASGLSPGFYLSGAWIAIGEYGSMDLSPLSPVELLILLKPNQSAVPGETIEQLRLLFQASGVQLQVTIISVKECLHQASQNVAFGSKLLFSRFLCGDANPYREFNQRFRTVVLKNPLAFVCEITDFLKRIHADYGEIASRIDADLTLGAGGLLDSQIFLGCLRILTGTDNTERLVEERHLSPREWTTVQRGRDFLLRLRNTLEFSSDFQGNVLSKEVLEKCADFLGFKESVPKVAGVRFLREVQIQRRKIDHVVSRFLEQARLRHGAGAEENKLRYLRFTGLSATAKSKHNENGTAVSSAAGPEKWMKRFRFSQTEPALFDRDVEDNFLSEQSQWDIHLFDVPAIHAEFRQILKNRGKIAISLRRMHGLGFLKNYCPEFGRLDCLPELEPYRNITLDEHTLRTIEILDNVVNTKSPGLHDYQRVMDAVADPSLIYAALLLHESGKSVSVREHPHHEHFAAKALRRMNFDMESIEKILLLVREQHLLTRVSQRRDLDDPLILQDVCDTLETADNLNMLLLFTYADSFAWGGEDWNDRKDFMLWSLYFRVYDRLMFGDAISEPEHAQVTSIQQKVLEQLSREFETETILRHFTLLPEKYALYTPLQQILSHIRLCERLHDKPVVTLWTPHASSGYTELMVSTLDLPGRFAQIAGTLTALEIPILSAQLNTREDEIVIDTFQVGDVNGNAILDVEIWNRVDRLLADIITGTKSLDDVLGLKLQTDASYSGKPPIPPRVRIDNEIASQCTVIEVQAGDRLGLGYRLAAAISSLGLNILSAKLATEKGHAFDVFYVQTKEGEKVTSSFQMTEVLERLRAVAK